MRQVSQEEFERYVEEMIAGNMSRIALAQLMETDLRTLKNKLQEVVATNPALYQRYIEKFPYKPKEMI